MTGVSQEEFEQWYADNSKLTLEQIRQYRSSYVCLCREEGCRGWVMLTPEMAENEREFGRIP